MGTLETVLQQDSTLASHPIIQPVKSPDEITQLFDSITYNKGAAVIGMMANFMKADVFRKGITKYLNQFKYKNAATIDFLDVMSEFVDYDITLVMQTWLEQMGVPILEINELSDVGYRLTQERFLTNHYDYDTRHVRSRFE